MPGSCRGCWTPAPRRRLRGTGQWVLTMPVVIVSPSNVVGFLRGGGGHFWVYLQYVLGLRSVGCDVFWLERVGPAPGTDADAAAFLRLMERFGLAGNVILYRHERPDGATDPASPSYVNVTREAAEGAFRRADLLLNFHHTIEPALLARFRRTALVDIDPGLLQFWISAGQLRVARHDVYLTIGETVGTPGAHFPDCGLAWRHIRPPVYLEAWPFTHDAACECFTTVSNWFGHNDWVIDGRGTNYENTKRASFLQFADLPRATPQPMELALFLGDTEHDARDRAHMEERGWRIRHCREVAGTPDAYRAYVQASRGELSCAKPSYVKLRTGWVSDRTLCYLASGKPAVVQDTGPSRYLPSGRGLFRVRDIAEAAEAVAAINANYALHCREAREIAEAHFDAADVVRRLLEISL